MDRTLYLNENKKIDIKVDGPSLWIKEEGYAGFRVPVRLIERVVISGDLKIPTGLIFLFAQNDVPVIFVRKKEEAAFVLPYESKPKPNYFKQKFLLKNDTTIDRYLNFIEAKREISELYLFNRLTGKAATKLRNDFDYDNFIFQYLKCKSNICMFVKHIISTLLFELIVSVLIKSEFDVHCGILNRGQDYGFARDVAYTLEPEVDLQAILFFNTPRNLLNKETTFKIDPIMRRGIIHRFENRKDTIKNLVIRFTDEVNELIRGLKKR